MFCFEENLCYWVLVISTNYFYYYLKKKEVWGVSFLHRDKIVGMANKTRFIPNKLEDFNGSYLFSFSFFFFLFSPFFSFLFFFFSFFPLFSNTTKIKNKIINNFPSLLSLSSLLSSFPLSPSLSFLSSSSSSPRKEIRIFFIFEKKILCSCRRISGSYYY